MRGRRLSPQSLFTFAQALLLLRIHFYYKLTDIMSAARMHPNRLHKEQAMSTIHPVFALFGTRSYGSCVNL
jgi:hypothetical protein